MRTLIGYRILPLFDTHAHSVRRLAPGDPGPGAVRRFLRKSIHDQFVDWDDCFSDA
jgi:hypothetical protein